MIKIKVKSLQHTSGISQFSKITGLFLGKRSFLIKLPTSNFSKFAAFYQWRIHFKKNSKISSFNKLLAPCCKGVQFINIIGFCSGFSKNAVCSRVCIKSSCRLLTCKYFKYEPLHRSSSSVIPEIPRKTNLLYTF